MLIVDAHLDLAWNALQWNRDLLRSVYTIRTTERTSKIAVPGLGMGTVAFPEMREGKVGLSFATLVAKSTGHPQPHVDYPSPTQAYASARGQLAYYRALESEGYARIITDVASLDSHVAQWQTWAADEVSQSVNGPPLGFVISMESADPILTPDQLAEWWEAGVRVVGPAHYGPGRYAGGHDTELGLTDLGKSLLTEMERVGMILDTTHLSDQSFWQALDRFAGPVIASHSNCRALVPHQRQLSDEQLRIIIERDGVVGVAFIALMLRLGWILGESSNEGLTMESVIDHIDHICQLAGDARHAAIGTDLDGGCGWETVTHDLGTIADLQKLPHLLKNRGYSDRDVAQILHGNWLRLLRAAWDEG